jgi:spermidine synthase
VPTPEGMSRRLVDGTTVHGSQNMKYSVTKTLDYYGPTTGISVAINYMQQQSSLKMAIIGLGAGVLASYARHGDKIDFYELNPAVKIFAYEYFDYLHTTLGNIEIKLGDGRLSLTKELKQSGSNNLDLLVIDAFTSDSIPTHLLTQEAFALYWQHIRTNGLLVIHISNSHLDLKPVIAAQGQTLGKTSLFFKTQSRSISHYASEWLVMTENAAFIAEEIRLKRATQLNNVETILWTDDFSSLITVLKI